MMFMTSFWRIPLLGGHVIFYNDARRKKEVVELSKS